MPCSNQRQKFDALQLLSCGSRWRLSNYLGDGDNEEEYKG